MTPSPGRVLNYGSLNEDRVYRVRSIARPGETVRSHEYRLFAGGKGANQSVALAQAGARVWHAGKLGKDAGWLREKLAGCGVNVERVIQCDRPTGHAVIQVDDAGENSIVVFPGTNLEITEEERTQALAGFGAGDFLLLQNEINDVGALMRMGRARGMAVAFNPAAMTPDVASLPLDLVDLLFLNETEGEALTGTAAPEGILRALRSRLPAAAIVLTLGAAGAWVAGPRGEGRAAAPKVTAVDTTGAGDTFIGYCLALLLEGQPLLDAARFACRAAALAVTRPGAADSIPPRQEVEAWGGA